MSFKVIEGRKLIYEVIWGYRGSKNPENQIKVEQIQNISKFIQQIILSATKFLKSKG